MAGSAYPSLDCAAQENQWVAVVFDLSSYSKKWTSDPTIDYERRQFRDKQKTNPAFEGYSSSTSFGAFGKRFGTASRKSEIVKLDPMSRDGSSY
ncbi:hypothetical protein NPIL_16641 [Nephila pilipes]|uniref:Uncharacterized protein n=1 Tax=Nephila pilipes TaxID=299642 RepID=A0A8X6P9H2_NEPPI|nr:hypothetical protein NPIL_16641 [Nephila pilipes]